MKKTSVFFAAVLLTTIAGCKKSPGTLPASVNLPPDTAASGQIMESQFFYEPFDSPLTEGWHLAINDSEDSLRAADIETMLAEPNGLLTRIHTPTRAGNNAIRATLINENFNFRTELARPPVPMFSEYWYGFSIQIPTGWIQDPQGNILAQWHAMGGLTAKSQDSAATDNPPLALDVHDSVWEAQLHWNTIGPLSSGIGSGQKTFPLGNITPGHWVDWVVHAKWAYDSTGFLQIWMNGNKLVDYEGPTEYNVKNGPYFKTGFYHPAWKSKNASQAGNTTVPVGTAITMYVDELRVAMAPAGYNTVAPR